MDPSRRSEPSGRAGDLVAPHPEYSTLFVIWPEAEAPLEEEIRLALQARWPDIEQVDELDVSEDLIWGATWRIPAHGDVPAADHLVWAEPRGDLTDQFLEDGLGKGREYEAAKKCRWLVGIESRLDTARPLESFQAQLRFAAELAVPGLVAIYDDNALVIRSGAMVEELCRCPVPPRASTVYAAHEVQGADGTWWLHTHGLLRIGLPDLDFVGIPEHTLEDARELMSVVVDALLARGEMESDGTLLVGDRLRLRLLPLEEALPMFPADAPGGANDRAGEMADHAGDRLILMDPVRDATPLEQLGVMARSAGTLYKSSKETRRQQELSIARWGTFGQLFAMRRLHGEQDGWRFNVKLAFDQCASDSREHLWFEVLGMKPGKVHGRLLNEPVDVPGLRANQELWHSLDHLTDWLIESPHGIYDPETASVLLEEA